MITGFLKITALATLLLVSCKKNDRVMVPEPDIPQPALEYLDLGDKEIRQQMPGASLDFNKDGRKDIFFGTQLVGDPVYQQDKLQFVAVSDIETRLPVNILEQVPVISKSQVIPSGNFNGHNWYEASAIVLVQKVTGVNVPVFWEGNWQTAVRKYLPVQVIKNNQRFNGWVELTVDTIDEKIVLHRAAISKVADKEIKAG